MRRRSTGHTCSFGRAAGGLAFAWVLVTGSTGWAEGGMERLPGVSEESTIASAHAGGVFDFGGVMPGEVIGQGSVLDLLDHDAPPLVEATDFTPPATAIYPDPSYCYSECWCWQLLPDGLIYRSYLAGVKEPRFAAKWVYERDQGWFYEVALGGRMGILRYGTNDPLRPEGWQLDLEGAVFPRIEVGSLDLTAMDFRYGIPLTYGRGRHRVKLAFYHMSSHLGDEFVLNNPGVRRINFCRDALVWGHSFYWTEDLRLYGEAAYAVYVDGGSQPWEFQLGIDYSPAAPTGFWPAPFIAVNCHLREEVAFGGNLVVQTGCQWRGATGNLLRLGIHYFAGKSDQYQFFDRYEDKLGLGIWYDY